MIGTMIRYVSFLKNKICVSNRTKDLVRALRNHRFYEVRNLLEHNPDSINANGNINDDTENTPLWVACHRAMETGAIDAKKIVALLLEHGADPNHGRVVMQRNGERYNYNEHSPIWFLIGHDGTNEVLSHLLRYGADSNAVNHSYDQAPLHFVCRNADYDKIELLLRHGANVNKLHKGGESSMFKLLSARGPFDDNHLSCLRLLLEYGADPNVISPCGTIPLFLLIHCARGPCRLDAIRLMMRHGADVTKPLSITPIRVTPPYDRAKCIKGDTILHGAIRLRDVDAVRAMTEHQETWEFWWLRHNDDKTVYEVAAQLDAVPNIECFEMNLRNERYNHFFHDWIHQ